MVNHATKNPWVKMKENSSSEQGHKIVKRIINKIITKKEHKKVCPASTEMVK